MRCNLLLSLVLALAVNIVLCAQEKEVADTLAGAYVTTERSRDDNATQTGLERIDKRRLDAGFAFLSSPDVIKVIQSLPGVASGTELMSGLYVHGGDGSDNLFLLDGVPLYQVSHLAGLFSLFNSDIVERLDFYKSGFPGRFGGRLSSVVDVRTEAGDFRKYHGVCSIGLIDGRLQFGGPIVKDRLSFNVAVRRSWIDVLSVPGFAIYNKNRTDKTDAGYSFYDANASLAWKISERNRLTARFYMGDDMLRMIKSERQKYYDEDVHYGYDSSRMKVKWGNILASVAWDSRIDDALSSEVIMYYSRSRARITFGMDDWELDEERGEVITQMEETNYSRIHDVGLRVDINYRPHKNHHLRLGVKYDWVLYTPEHNRSVTAFDQMTGDGSCLRYADHELAVYAEDEMSLTGWMTLNLGLRYAPVFVSNRTWHHIEPRAALKFQCGDNVIAKASYAEMNQFAHWVATTYFDLPVNCWMPSTDKVRPMHSRQFAAGVYTRLPYHLELDVEGFYKTMDHLLEFCGSNSLFPPLDTWENDFVEGRGRAWGLETKFGYRTEATDVSLYYTLSWNRRNFKDIFDGWYPDRYDNRHKITIVGTHKFSDRFDIYAAWNYHSGNRITAPSYIVGADGFGEEYYSHPNNVKLPDYHRLDIGVNFRKITRRGNERCWNISIYNVYCRMNAINASVERGEDGRYLGLAYAVVPIVPTFSYTLKF